MGEVDEPSSAGSARSAAPGEVFGSVRQRELAPRVAGQDLTTLVAGNTRFALEQ